VRERERERASVRERDRDRDRERDLVRERGDLVGSDGRWWKGS
jgi:hypothetical protein